ncbi:MAG: hypothetical protein KGI08_10670, partial [Thaumarchaeota archaeon]|nr:hypothetical protein [Nitrososphaerota archaeon]
MPENRGIEIGIKMRQGEIQNFTAAADVIARALDKITLAATKAGQALMGGIGGNGNGSANNRSMPSSGAGVNAPKGIGAFANIRTNPLITGTKDVIKAMDNLQDKTGRSMEVLTNIANRELSGQIKKYNELKDTLVKLEGEFQKLSRLEAQGGQNGGVKIKYKKADKLSEEIAGIHADIEASGKRARALDKAAGGNGSNLPPELQDKNKEDN